MNWNSEREKYDETGAAKVKAYVERLAKKRAARDAAAEPAPSGPAARPEIHHPAWWAGRYARHGGRVQPRGGKSRPPW
jgi:hypothetical protein